MCFFFLNFVSRVCIVLLCFSLILAVAVVSFSFARRGWRTGLCCQSGPFLLPLQILLHFLRVLFLVLVHLNVVIFPWLLSLCFVRCFLCSTHLFPNLRSILHQFAPVSLLKLLRKRCHALPIKQEKTADWSLGLVAYLNWILFWWLILDIWCFLLGLSGSFGRVWGWLWFNYGLLLRFPFFDDDGFKTRLFWTIWFLLWLDELLRLLLGIIDLLLNCGPIKTVNFCAFVFLLLLWLRVFNILHTFLNNFTLVPIPCPIPAISHRGSPPVLLHPRPFLGVIRLPLLHILVILFPPFICQSLIRSLFLIWHLFPHPWSNLCDLSTTDHVVLLWNLRFFLVVKEKEAWGWALRFVVAFESLT